MSLVLGVEILGEYKNLTAATKGAQTQLQKLNAGAQKISSGMNRAFAAIGIGFSLAAITRGLTSAVEAAEKVQQSDQRLEQVAKSMGLFGDETAQVTAKLKKYADRLELSTGVEAETIKLAQAKLFTFKQLGKTAGELDGQFDRATKAALDLAATGFGTAETNAVQLGKALQDPIKGITALARAGVTFTAEEKEKIKVLVEGNKLLEAQDLILSAIEQQVGGVAEATAKSSDKIKNAFGQIEDAIGLALLPLLDEFSNWLATPDGSAKLEEVIQFFQTLLRDFGKLVGFIIANKDWLLPVITAIGLATGAWKIYITTIGLVAAAEKVFAGTSIATAASVGAAWTAANLAKLGALGAVAGLVLSIPGSSMQQPPNTPGNPNAFPNSPSFGTAPKTTSNKIYTPPVTLNVKATQNAKQITQTLTKGVTSSGQNINSLISGGGKVR
jgi:hypothetical protein